MKVLHIFLALVVLLGTSCNSQTDASKSTAQKEIALVKDVDPQEFAQLLKEQPGIIIDVRTAGEVSQGTLENAQHIDILQADFMKKVNELDKEKAVYVYCKKGGRSANATEKMVNAGFKNVYNLLGGYDGWKASGYATTK